MPCLASTTSPRVAPSARVSRARTGCACCVGGTHFAPRALHSQHSLPRPRRRENVGARNLTRTSASREERRTDAEQEETERASFAAATGLFSSAVFRKMSKDAPRGPACLLDAESAPEDEPEGGFGLSTGALALVLGVAGFGRVSHHHVPDMEAVAHAAVLTKTAEATTSIQSKYSGSLLPAATSARGKARPPASIAGQDPHFQDVICSRWFVGSLNALG